MSIFEHITIAIDAIRANPVRAFLTTLGVLIGVLSVILLVGLGDAVRSYVLETLSGIGSNLIQIRAGKQETRGMQPPSMNVRNRLTMEDANALERRAYTLDGVSPLVLGSGELRTGDLRRNVMVLGVGTSYPNLRNLRMGEGSFFTSEDLESRRKIVVIGETIVKELFGPAALDPPPSSRLLPVDSAAGGRVNPLGQTIFIASVPFRVVGVLAPKGKTFGFDMDDLAYVPATSAQDLFSVETVSEIIARARDRKTVQPAIEEISEVLSGRRNGAVDFTIFSQDDMMATVNKIMTTLTFFLGAIASISLLVGGIGIMNIMLVSVKERTREIGVRRAVGARWRDILVQFLVEAVVVSLLGGTVGLFLGFLIIQLVHRFQPDLPVELSGWNVAMALSFSAFVGIVSGVFPAVRAADLDPVEALRYE